MRLISKIFLMGCAAPVALIGASASAQQAAPAGSGLEEVVVTAQRVEQNLQAVPVAVSAFTPKDLEERRISAITDLGQSMPNVRITSQQFGQPGTPYITIRGVTNTSVGLGQDAPVGLYLD